MKGIILSSLAAMTILVIPATSSALEILNDGFEYQNCGGDPTDPSVETPLDNGWLAHVNTSEQSLQTAKAPEPVHSGSCSLKLYEPHPTTSSAIQRNFDSLSLEDKTLDVTAWYYDDLHTGFNHDRAIRVVFGDGSGSLVSAGLWAYNGDTNFRPTYLWEGAGQQAYTTVQRTLGWHKFEWKVDSEGVDMFIDGNQVVNNLFVPSTLEFMTLHIGEPIIGYFDDVSLTITTSGGNQPPNADAGEDDVYGLFSELTLDGTGSSDPDGEVLTYQWFEDIDNPVTGLLDDYFSPQPTLQLPVAGKYTFSLVVNDGLIDSAPDHVVINAIDTSDFSKLLGHLQNNNKISQMKNYLDEAINATGVGDIIEASRLIRKFSAQVADLRMNGKISLGDAAQLLRSASKLLPRQNASSYDSYNEGNFLVHEFVYDRETVHEIANNAQVAALYANGIMNKIFDLEGDLGVAAADLIGKWVLTNKLHKWAQKAEKNGDELGVRIKSLNDPTVKWVLEFLDEVAGFWRVGSFGK